ncbi:hypothetical protein V2G26_002501 [Clonostachys chloroleuca]
MSNLETLDVAVPDTLLHGMGMLFNGPFDLACLKSCTLFYQTENDQYWDLYENIHIFAHPTLETLVIKRAKLDYRGFDLIEQPHETALSKLHLIECDINDDALSDLLMFPKALKEFVMTQNEEPSPELEESSDSIRDYMIAVKSACHSLETVTIDFPTLMTHRALALREFDHLKTLRINWDHQLFGKTSKKPRLHSAGLPPSWRRSSSSTSWARTPRSRTCSSTRWRTSRSRPVSSRGSSSWRGRTASPRRSRTRSRRSPS